MSGIDTLKKQLHDAIIIGNVSEFQALVTKVPQILKESPAYQNSNDEQLQIGVNQFWSNFLDSKITDSDSLALTPLQFAARNGYLSIVIMLLAQASQIGNQKNPVKLINKQYLLHFAAAQGHADIVEYLAAQTYTPAAPPPQKDTRSYFEIIDDAIAIAIDDELEDKPEAIITQTVDIQAKMSDGNTALHLAASHGQVNVINIFMAHERKYILLMETNQKGQTPLQCAVIAGKKDAITALVAAHHNAAAYINFKDNESPSALELAAANKEITTLLTTLMSSKPAPRPSAASSSSTENPRTSMQRPINELHGLIQTNDYAAVESYFSRVSVFFGTLTSTERNNAISQQDENGNSALHLAVQTGNSELVDLVFKNYHYSKAFYSDREKIERAKLLGQKNNRGETAAHLATKAGKPFILKYLAIHDAELNIPDNQGRLPIHLLIEFGNTPGHFRCFDIFKENPATISLPNSQKENVLHIASKNLNLDTNLISQLFSDKNATTLLTVPNNNGDLPIHTAVRHANLNVIAAILRKYPNQVNQKNTLGQTPLHIAAADSVNFNDLFKQLNITYLNIDEKDNGGNTALHIAYQSSNFVVADILINAGCNQTLTNHDGKTAAELDPRTMANQIKSAAGLASSSGNQQTLQPTELDILLNRIPNGQIKSDLSNLLAGTEEAVRMNDTLSASAKKLKNHTLTFLNTIGSIQANGEFKLIALNEIQDAVRTYNQNLTDQDLGPLLNTAVSSPEYKNSWISPVAGRRGKVTVGSLVAGFVIGVIALAILAGGVALDFFTLNLTLGFTQLAVFAISALVGSIAGGFVSNHHVAPAANPTVMLNQYTAHLCKNVEKEAQPVVAGVDLRSTL